MDGSWTGPSAFGGAAAALARGLLTTCFYEFVHCIQHLAYKPKNKRIADMKRRHMAHHFHDEDGNYGITTFFWDKVFGTWYDRPERPEKSPTVFNLGYTEEVAKVYPYVSELSGGVATGHPRQREAARPELSAAAAAMAESIGPCERIKPMRRL